MRNPEVLFSSHKLLIYSRVHYYARKYGLDFEDLKSEAFLIFCEAVEKFRPSRSKFSTFIFNELGRLNYYCIKEKRIPSKDLDNLTYTQDLDRGILFKQAIQNLSSDGQEVLSSILFDKIPTPTVRHRHITESRLLQFLKDRGWTSERSRAVWEELKTWWGRTEPVFDLV